MTDKTLWKALEEDRHLIAIIATSNGWRFTRSIGEPIHIKNGTDGLRDACVAFIEETRGHDYGKKLAG